MIDFRYHLVSLIAVFLALALGIVLGSGPLREAIGDSVSGRTQELEQQVSELQGERDAAVADRDAADAALEAAGAGLVEGVLPGHRVAVVALGDVPDEVRAALDERLTQAGATVSAHVALTDAWYDPAQRSFRQGLVGFLLDYLDPVPPAGAGLEAELSQALVQGLVAADPAAPDQRTEDASVLLELLSTGDTPLVSLEAPVTEPADAVVVLAPAEVADTASALALVRAAQEGSSAAVLAEAGRLGARDPGHGGQPGDGVRGRRGRRADRRAARTRAARGRNRGPLRVGRGLEPAASARRRHRAGPHAGGARHAVAAAGARALVC